MMGAALDQCPRKLCQQPFSGLVMRGQKRLEDTRVNALTPRASIEKILFEAMDCWVKARQ
jgi:hypothetical protein